MYFKIKYFISILSFALLVFLMGSCDIYPDPSIEKQITYSYIKNGFDQRGYAGNYLNDSIVIELHSNSVSTYGFKVHFDVLKGGGFVDDEVTSIDRSGKGGTKWKLGNVSLRQILKTTIFDNTGNLIGEFTSNSYGLSPEKWDTISALPEIQIEHLVADTINHVTFMTTVNKLYKQGNNYFDWIEVEAFSNKSPFSVEMDKNGIIYVSTWNGELYKSTDHGSSWIQANKPFSTDPYYYYLHVTPDGTLWASKWEYAMRYSKDGGYTWSNTTLDITQQPKKICNLSDGTFLMLTGSQLLRSEDGGFSWTNLNAEPFTSSLYVTDKDEVILITEGNGLTIKRSTDRGDHFTSLYTAIYYFSSSILKHGFYKRGSTYYILLQGRGIITTQDFQDFKYFWINKNILDLFMDHRKTLITTELNNKNAYYYSFSQN